MVPEWHIDVTDLSAYFEWGLETTTGFHRIFIMVLNAMSPEGFPWKVFNDRVMEKGCGVHNQLVGILLIGWLWGNHYLHFLFVVICLFFLWVWKYMLVKDFNPRDRMDLWWKLYSKLDQVGRETFKNLTWCNSLGWKWHELR